MTRTRGPDSQARKSWLGQEVQITKQEVMARIGKVRIAMHGRLSRGMSALDRELAMALVGLGVWINIDSNRDWCMGCLVTLEEFLIFQRCCVDIESNIEWFSTLKEFLIF